MLQTKVVKNVKTRILYSITVPENLSSYEILGENMVEPERSQKVISYGPEKMQFSSRVSKARM